MKSIYIDNNLHNILKSLAILENRSLMELISEILTKATRRKLDELKTKDLSKLAMLGQSFDFLFDKREDIYSLDDGEEI